MYQTLTPNLMTDSIEATCAFYTEKLGFTVAASVPSEATGLLQFAILVKDEVEIMFQERVNLAGEYPALAAERTKPCCSLFIGVDDVQALHDQLAESVELAAPLHTTFYGTDEFAVLDNNGYVLTFAKARA